MNLKSCVTKSKSSKHYIPHQLRSRPLRCMIFPIFVVFLFILFWFIMCPLIFIDLLKRNNDWPKEWPFYYWIVALIVFAILMSILVCLWRCSRAHKAESPLLINSSLSKNGNLKQNYTVSLNTIQKSQDKLETAPIENKRQNHAVKPNFELAEENPKNSNKTGNTADRTFSRCSIHHKPQGKTRPTSLAIPTATETKAEIHSASSPLTPRELFFWDLIQSANKSRSSVTHNFIEREREHCSLDGLSLSSPKCSKSDDGDDGVQRRAPRSEKSSAEYFIANVSDRKSLTTEIFMYVDGGKEEKCLKIRTSGDGDDDVFQN